jgi:hypothetical protein
MRAVATFVNGQNSPAQLTIIKTSPQTVRSGLPTTAAAPAASDQSVSVPCPVLSPPDPRPLAKPAGIAADFAPLLTILCLTLFIISGMLKKTFLLSGWKTTAAGCDFTVKSFNHIILILRETGGGVVMVGRVLAWILALSVFVLLATPFAHDLWNRYMYIKEVYELSDPVARAALAQRYGAVGGFADDVMRRCRRLHGADQAGCVRYALRLRGP